MQLNCWSLRCSWSIACRRCSNYIFILDLTPGFNGLGKGNCKTRETKTIQVLVFGAAYGRDFTVYEYQNIHIRFYITSFEVWPPRRISCDSLHIFIYTLLYFEAICVNSSPPGQNGYHFVDDIFRCIFVNENFCILIEIFTEVCS